MSKKIYDIRPPEKRQSYLADETKATKYSKGFFAKVAIILLAIFGTIYFFTFRVEIEIWPKTEAIELEKSFVVDATEEVLNSVLPGTIFETDFFEEIRTFSATGIETANTKATGTVIIHNKHWDHNQPLIQGTRFETPDGKIFRATDGVIVPGRQYEGGVIIPGEVEIEVIADKAGREYNIDPTKFTLPGLKGAPSFEGVTAISKEPMIGGAIGERTVVSAEDIEKAREEVLQALLEQGQSILKSEKGDEFLFDDASQFSYNIEAEEISARPSEEAKQFTVKIRARINAFTFKKSDLRSLLKRSILTEVDTIKDNGLESSKEIYEDSLSFTYRLENIDWEKGTASLQIEFIGEIYSPISQSRLKDIAMGKSITDLEAFLENQAFIRKAVIKFKPFGVGAIPDNTERIKIETKFN